MSDTWSVTRFGNKLGVLLAYSIHENDSDKVSTPLTSFHSNSLNYRQLQKDSYTVPDTIHGLDIQ